jgi:hypothetical protein
MSVDGLYPAGSTLWSTLINHTKIDPVGLWYTSQFYDRIRTADGIKKNRTPCRGFIAAIPPVGASFQLFGSVSHQDGQICMIDDMLRSASENQFTAPA